MQFFRRVVVTLLAGLSACAGPDSSEPIPWGLETIEVPAGVGSRWSYVSPDGDGMVIAWLESDESDVWSLNAARYGPEGWAMPHTVATSADNPFFVNWADFPSVVPMPDGQWAAHWLERGAAGGYDYGVRFSRSQDQGESWSDPVIPHEDGTPTEHGFVTLFPTVDDGIGIVWFDGRFTGDGEGATRGAMSLRYRSFAADGTPGPEMEIDHRTCDCCQTDAAMTSQGPVVVYRNRTEEEVRDIYISRLIDGEWTEGMAVHDDGWVIPGCPVNGPGVDARDEDVVVAWFSAGQRNPRVQVAFSSDGGASFGPPTRIDEGNPVGRADVRLLEDGTALVSWLETTSQESGQILVRRITPSGEMLEIHEVVETSPKRNSGFPRMAQDSEGRIVFTWTETGETGGVRMARTVGPVGTH
jgi:hypothetical protein